MEDRIEGLNIRESDNKYLESQFSNRDVDLPDDPKLYAIEYKDIKHYFLAKGDLLTRNAESQTQCCAYAFKAIHQHDDKSYKSSEFLDALVKDENIKAAANIVDAMYNADGVSSIVSILGQTEHITAYKILANMDTAKACEILQNLENRSDVVEIAAEVCSAIRMKSPQDAIDLAETFIFRIGLSSYDAKGINRSGDAIVIFAKKNPDLAIDVAVALVVDGAKPRAGVVLSDNIAAIADAVAKLCQESYPNGNDLAVSIVDAISMDYPKVAIDVADRIVAAVKRTNGLDNANLIDANIVSKIEQSNQELADKIKMRIQNN